MTDQDALDQAFRSSLGLAGDLDLAQTAYGKTDEWDSVAHMQLVAAIENAFGIMLDTNEVVGMSSYEVARRILRENHGLDLDA